MDWVTGIQNAIIYIENHMTDEIDMELVEKEAAHEVFSKLYYDEQYMIANRLGFCMDCFSDYYVDNTITDKDGNTKKLNSRK